MFWVARCGRIGTIEGVHSQGAGNWRQLMAGSGGSQGLPVMAPAVTVTDGELCSGTVTSTRFHFLSGKVSPIHCSRLAVAIQQASAAAGIGFR